MPFGILPPRKTILLLLLWIFLFETWSETIRLLPGSLCTTSSTCSLPLRLPEGSWCIVISVLLSLFFQTVCYCNNQFYLVTARHASVNMRTWICIWRPVYNGQNVQTKNMIKTKISLLLFFVMILTDKI